MNHISFAVGDRVRHKLTQIQAEIVQLEESLAMPHAWVIEPSVCDVNPPTLYRLIDLEKVEDEGKKAQTTNQAQGVNPNISLSKEAGEKDDLTSKEFPSDKSDRINISLSKEMRAEDDLTSKQLLRDNGTDRINISLSKNETGINNSTSKELPRDNSTAGADLSWGKRRRYKGHGSGAISWRTLTRNGRDYHQPWYQYEFWDKGKCTLKSSKYIPKKLLQQVQQMNQAKVPVLEILAVLGANTN